MVLRLSIETLWTKDLENTQRKDENRKLDPLGWWFLESRAWVFISSTVLSFAYIRDNSSSNCQVQAKISKDQTLIFSFHVALCRYFLNEKLPHKVEVWIDFLEAIKITVVTYYAQSQKCLFGVLSKAVTWAMPHTFFVVIIQLSSKWVARSI